IQVRIVGVLALFAPDRREEQRLRLVVPAVDRHGDELPFGDAVLQRAAVRVIEVIVSPAVALGPVQQVLAVVDQAQRARLDVGVHPFFDDRLDLARRRIGDAHVKALHVAAQPREVDLVGARAQPFRRHAGRGGLTLAAASALAALSLPAAERARILALALRRRRRGDRQVLILEAIGLHHHTLAGCDLEDLHLFLVDVLFARHRVAVGLERRTRARQRVDDPEVLHLALVAPNQREALRIGRPHDVDGVAAPVLDVGGAVVLLLLLLLVLLLALILLLLLLLIVLAAADGTGVAVVLFAVGGQLLFDDRGVGRRLLRLCVVGRVHRVEVVVAREEHGLAVGRERRPARARRRRDVVFVEPHCRGRQVVLEAQRPVAGRLALRAGAGSALALLLLLRIVVVDGVFLPPEGGSHLTIGGSRGIVARAPRRARQTCTSPC